MEAPSPPRRLIVNADDFGRSSSVNAAVVRAHREGILTTTSLMVNETAAAEAVALATENPRLGVGLHLTLLCGRSALPPERIPGLVDAAGRFSDNPVITGMRYFFARRLRAELTAEIAAQFERFHATGLRLDHVNGHLNLHLHPVVLGILQENARSWGMTHLRLTLDPFWLNARVAFDHRLYQVSHHVIFRALSARARPALRRLGIRHTERVFGLLQNARLNEDRMRGLLSRLPAGDSELYSHPSLDEFKHELDALISPRIKALVAQQDIHLIRYQDL